MKYILTIFLFFFGLLVHAQDKINFSSLSISDSLKKNANVIFLLDEAVVDISSPSHYTYKVHRVYNIQNAEGAYYLRHSLPYDKFQQVDKVEIGVYNSLGLLTKKYNKKDFESRAAYDGISLITDDKVMRLYTPAPGFPCTIDVEYTFDVKSYMELPDRAYVNHNASIGMFRYIVMVPNELDIRHQSVNCKIVPQVEQMEKKKKYTWEAKNIVATKYQEGGFEPYYSLPRIQVAPNFFEYDGYNGSFRNWNEYGKWSYQLYQETNPFSKERIADIKNLVAGKQDVRSKVEILYSYLQKNFRYVSIQLGIGGFKPFAVKFVDDKKYGDCKALTNYMRYLLQVADIPSYPALINAGYDSPPVDPDFPGSYFNHVILCVPNKSDSIWLECTSNDNEAGFLGSFTENKNALLLTENGGIMVKTPASRQEKNILQSYTKINLAEDGSAKSNVSLVSSGDILSDFKAIKLHNKDEQKEIFVNRLQYTVPDEFLLMESKEQSNENLLSLEFAFEKLYSFKAGSKYFFPQKLNKLVTEQLKDEVRTTAYVFEYPFLKVDTTVFILPANFIANELPAKKELQNEFASYKKHVEYNKDTKQLMIITSFGIKQHIIPAKSYNKLVELFKEVQQDESEKLVLVAQ